MPIRQEPEKTANQATWSIIIGCLLGVILILGSAYAENSLAALIVAALLIAYVVVLMYVGRINVFLVLWGRPVDESDDDINPRIVMPATVVIALVTIGIFLYDLLGDENWGWYSWVAAAVAIGYLGYVVRHSQSPSNTTE